MMIVNTLLVAVASSMCFVAFLAAYEASAVELIALEVER